MENEGESQRYMKVLVDAIRKTIRELNPTLQVTDEPIDGLIILMFPKDHKETSIVTNTFLGKICETHAIECIIETGKQVRVGVLDYAA